MKLSRNWFNKILRSKYIHIGFSDGVDEIKNVRFIFGNPFYKSKIKSDKKTELISFKPIKNRKYKYPVFDYSFNEVKNGNLIKQDLYLFLTIYGQTLSKFKQKIINSEVKEVLFFNSKGNCIKKTNIFIANFHQNTDLICPGDNFITSYKFNWHIDSQYKMKDV